MMLYLWFYSLVWILKTQPTNKDVVCCMEVRSGKNPGKLALSKTTTWIVLSNLLTLIVLHYRTTLKPVKSGTVNSGIILGTFTNLSPASYPTGFTPRSETINSQMQHSKRKTVTSCIWSYLITHWLLLIRTMEKLWIPFLCCFSFLNPLAPNDIYICRAVEVFNP